MANPAPAPHDAAAARWVQRGIPAAVCVAVIAVYVWMAREGAVTQPSLNPAGSY
jgi:hypothetical protein